MLEELKLEFKSCIDDFHELINQDKYISKKDYQEFLDKYKTLFNHITLIEEEKKNKRKKKKEIDENIDEYKNEIIKIANSIDVLVKDHNKLFVARKLNEYSDYFDNMFKEVAPEILLDEEQRRAILTNEDYSLVVAGAGSGKTTTMVAKVKYLIEKCNVNPDEIVILSLTNETVKELESRLNDDFKLNVSVKTFHKLGLEILNDRIEQKVCAIEDYQKIELINNYVKNILFLDKELLNEALELFKRDLKLDPECLNYETYEEYWDYYTRKVYKENRKNLKSYNNYIIESRREYYRTIRNEYVRSKAEVDIANFLYTNNIQYFYEAKYEDGLDKVVYHPDFTVKTSNNKKIYIEYYGLDSFNSNGLYTEKEIERYKLIEKRKRALHEAYGTDLIEVYPTNNTDVIEFIKEELRKRSVFTIPKIDYEIFIKLMKTSINKPIYYFSNYIVKFISRYKSKGYTQKDFALLYDKTDDDIVKRKIDIVKKIYKYYNNYIYSRYMVDFEDMINYAYRYMEEKPIANTNLNYKYVIVDEYQDISYQRYNLLQTISNVFNAKIVAVGDDWQSIFGFTGSEIKLFTDFCELMGYGETLKITSTYRNSQELVDVAGDFVLKNQNQYEKKLISSKHLSNPVEIIYYDYESPVTESMILEKLLKDLYDEDKTQTIALLGRYNDDIDFVLENPNFKEEIKSENRIIYQKLPDFDIRFLTVHSAKGLGFDQVILLNALDATRGFPSKRRKDALLNLLDDEKQEGIKYAEERRLFYVALTRTKKKIYILTPDYKESSFITEIRNYDNVIINNNYINNIK